ncbi:MAG: 16S rRNA (guanine(527)-N(7))-methyltransferase RsmG [Alphaproteobacteria bacterium]|nr:16S rRNA (guanine(527)-N(7))-methyltransferase RsmG [Alphaproteobacteria bacterium]
MHSFTVDDFINSLESVTVSRETIEKLKIYAELLKKWQKTINLVSSATIPDMWQRHFLDSAQLIKYFPKGAKKLVDMGSGAGFPVLVLALLNPNPELEIHAIESDTRKVAFMREVIRNCQLTVNVHNCRIEQTAPFPAQIITARALAPLRDLLTYVHPFITNDSVCLFLKGQNIDTEIKDMHRKWNAEIDLQPSLSDPSGKVAIIRNVREI